MRLRQTGYWNFYYYRCWCNDCKATRIGFLWFYGQYLGRIITTKGICLLTKHDYKELEHVKVEGDHIQYTGVIVYECQRCGKEIPGHLYLGG